MIWSGPAFFGVHRCPSLSPKASTVCSPPAYLTLKTYGALGASSMVLRQQAIFTSFLSPSPFSLPPPPPPTTFLPREHLLFLSPSSPRPQSPPRPHPPWSRLSALQRKFCPSAPFRKMISPKSLGKKNSLSLIDFVTSPSQEGPEFPGNLN